MDEFEKHLKIFERNIKKYVENLIQKIRIEFTNTHADGVILGMSGGLDCSVVAVLCKLGNIPVKLISLPRGDSMDSGQMVDAKELCEKFDFDLEVIPIGKTCQMVSNLCETAFNNWMSKKYNYNGNSDMADANLGPLQRMMFLSTLGQKINYAMVGTGNWTERYIGNFTKRGDGQCDFNPIGELTKSEIRIIAKHIGIPANIIRKPPSADLWEGQTDEEEMGLRIEDIDRYLITGIGDKNIINKINAKHKNSLHKLVPIPVIQRTDIIN